MNIDQYKNAIKICMKAGVPLMAWGPPGVGKTRGSEQVADELNIEHRNLQGPLLTPVDILGLPDKQDGRTIWLRPSILPESGAGIINIDELPDSVAIMQKVYYSLILDHIAGVHKISDTWYIMGAGNRPGEDKSFSSPIPAPLITRLAHIGVCCPVPDFTKQTVASAQIDIDQFLLHIVSYFHPLVIAFLKINSSSIYKHQATPRTWEYVSKFLYSVADFFSFELKELIKGTVGTGIGQDFNTFLTLASKMPSIDAILIDPHNAPTPDENNILYAVVTTLMKRINDKYMDNIIDYILRLKKEYQFFFFNSVQKTYRDVAANPKYIRWANENHEYLV